MSRSVLICWVSCLLMLQSITGQHVYDSVRNPKPIDFTPAVKILSSPYMEGRMTGEIGNKMAALYIGAIMRQLKLKSYIPSNGKPAEVFDHFQEFPLDKISRHNTYLVFTATNTTESDTFEIRKDFFAAPFYSDFNITGKLFISYINEPQSFKDDLIQGEITDLENHTGLHKDKDIYFASLEVYNDTPGSSDPYNTTTVQQEARKAVILLRTEEWQGDEWYMTRDHETEFCQSHPGPDPLVKTFFFTRDASQKIIDKYLKDSVIIEDNKRGNLVKGWQIWIKGDTISQRVEARNVIGVLEGKDTTRTLIIGAHYDHLGKDGDLIFYGADDNASGVAGVLSLAKMWQQSGVKPPINVMFACWAAEETGKLGSSYFVEGGSCPDQPILYINMDMISRSDPVDTLTEILSIGYRAQDKHLKQLCSGLNDQLPRPFKLDLWEVDGHSGSDYAPFVSEGVPVLSFFSGFHPDYHTSQDTFERIDTEKMERILHLVNDIIKSVLMKS